MTKTGIEEEILEFVRKLPPESQRRVRDFAQALVMSLFPGAEQAKKPLSGKEFAELIQGWDPEAAEELARAVEEEHEREKARYRAG
jgi:hypothetical protein